MGGMWPTIAFCAFIMLMLALDLGVFNKRTHEVKPKEAGMWVTLWVSLAVTFNIGVYYFMGMEKGLQFTTGYLIEQSLSVDNMFVFVLVMQSFRVPPAYQHKLLFYGVLGAIVMRGILIVAGVALVNQFHWMFYVFGAFLIYTGFRVMSEGESAHVDPSHNPLVQFFARHFPVIKEMRGARFFVREEIEGKLKWVATPMFLAVLCLEFTDLLFAVDSIPAIMAITNDPFILFTSNVFAILGLRSLYFLLAHMVGRFQLLKYGIGLVLGFVGLKMLTKDVLELPMVWSLGVIVVIIGGSVVLSLLLARRGTKPSARGDGM
jgi:tellurite resistance protein TerC